MFSWSILKSLGLGIGLGVMVLPEEEDVEEDKGEGDEGEEGVEGVWEGGASLSVIGRSFTEDGWSEVVCSLSVVEMV